MRYTRRPNMAHTSEAAHGPGVITLRFRSILASRSFRAAPPRTRFELLDLCDFRLDLRVGGWSGLKIGPHLTHNHQAVTQSPTESTRKTAKRRGEEAEFDEEEQGREPRKRASLSQITIESPADYHLPAPCFHAPRPGHLGLTGKNDV